MTELTRRRRFLVLAICCLSLLIVGMDNTIVNVALPSLSTSLHASLSDLQWTIDAYTLVLASLLVLSGSTGDRLGRRRTFQIGLSVFVLGSLLCSIAPGLGWLVAFRAVQAIGGSMLNPVAMSIITNVFTDRKERAFAIGVWGGVVGISIGVGPVVGGLLIQALDWRAIFWVNVPIGVAAFVLAAIFVPESRAARPRKPDPVGQVLVMLTLASLTYAIIDSPHHGWGSAQTLILLAVAVVAAIALVGYELRVPQPLIDPRFFASVTFSGATVIAVCAFGAYSGFLFLNSLYLQDVRGYSALTAGLCTLPLAVGALVFAPLSGRMVGTRGTRLPLLLAGFGLIAGAAMLLDLHSGTSLLWLLVAYTLFSIGFGWVNAPITNSAVSGMPISQAGVAAAVASTSRQIGATLGVAVVGSALNSRLGSTPLRTGFVDASTTAWAIVVACGCAVLVLGLVSSGRWARRTAEVTAARLAEEPVAVAA